MEKEPDCEECNHKMPEIEIGNLLFLRIISDSVGRDFNGMLDMNVFLKILDMYGEILNFDARDKLLLVRKANFVICLEAEHQKAKQDAKKNRFANAHKAKGPNLIGRK